jgi:hypothetical protein
VPALAVSLARPQERGQERTHERSDMPGVMERPAKEQPGQISSRDVLDPALVLPRLPELRVRENKQ